MHERRFIHEPAARGIEQNSPFTHVLEGAGIEDAVFAAGVQCDNRCFRKSLGEFHGAFGVFERYRIDIRIIHENFSAKGAHQCGGMAADAAIADEEHLCAVQAESDGLLPLTRVQGVACGHQTPAEAEQRGNRHFADGADRPFRRARNLDAEFRRSIEIDIGHADTDARNRYELRRGGCDNLAVEWLQSGDQAGNPFNVCDDFLFRKPPFEGIVFYFKAGFFKHTERGLILLCERRRAYSDNFGHDMSASRYCCCVIRDPVSRARKGWP